MQKKIQIGLSITEATNLIQQYYAEHYNTKSPEDVTITIHADTPTLAPTPLTIALNVMKVFRRDVPDPHHQSFQDKVKQIKILREILNLGIYDSKYLVESEFHHIITIWEKYRTFQNFAYNYKVLTNTL